MTLRSWKLAPDIEFIGTELEIEDLQADFDELGGGAQELIAAELRVQREQRKACVSAGYDPVTELSVPPRPGELSFEKAWPISQVDLARCEWLIRNRPEHLDLIAVHVNIVGWFRFFAVEHPSQWWRQRYSKAAREGSAQQDVILGKIGAWEAREFLRELKNGH